MLKLSLLAYTVLLGLTLPSQASLQFIMTDGTTMVSCTGGPDCDFAGASNKSAVKNSQPADLHCDFRF